MKQRSPAEVDAALARYAALIRRYHGTLDLVSGAALERLSDHLAEAWAYAGLVADLSPAPARLADLGSGVGLPGVVLAAALPELPVELIERRRKRTAFLSMAVAAVGPTCAEVRLGDARRLEGPALDVVTAQAVGPLTEIYAATRHRHGEAVVLVARKGAGWRAEVDALEDRLGATPEVLAALPRPGHGTLLAVRALGGRPCPSSE